MIALLLFANLPVSGDLSRVAVDAEAQVGYRSVSYAPTDGRFIEGNGEVNVSVYFGRPVEDDGSPIGLQPYLQRVSEIGVDVGGGAFNLSVQDFSRNGSSANVAGFYSGYPHRNVYLFGNFGLSYSTWTDSSTSQSTTITSLPLNLGGGFRWRETLIDAGWNVEPRQRNGGGFSVPFWGGAFLHVRTVMDRQWFFHVAVGAEQSGASGAITVEEYYGRQLSLALGGFGGHMKDPDDGTPVEWIGASGTVTYWTTAHLGGSVAYTPSWTRYTGADPYSVVRHLVTFGISSRL